MEQFEGQFTVAEIKQQWHNLLTNYKREKQREESSKSSGSGSSEVYTHLTGPIIIQCHSLTIHMKWMNRKILPSLRKKRKLPAKTSSRDDELSA